MLKKSLFILVCLLLSLAPMVVSGQDNSKYHKIAEIGRPAIEAIDWNPKQDLIAAATAHDIWLYDTQLKDVAHLDLAAAINFTQWPSKDNIRAVKSWRIQEVKWSPDGRWLTIQLSIYTPGNVWYPDIWQVWNWNGTEFTQVMPDRFQFVSKITWNADTSQYAVLAANKVYRFAAADNTLLSTADATDFSWNNAGTSIALLKSDSIELVDTQTQRQLVSFSTDESGFSDALWSPDDSKIGAISDNRLLIWDVKTGKVLSVFMSEIPNTWLGGAASPIFTARHKTRKIVQLQTPVAPPLVREKIPTWIWNSDSNQVVIVFSHPIYPTSRLSIQETTTQKIIHELPTGARLINLNLLKGTDKLAARLVGGSGYPFTQIIDTRTWEITNEDFHDTSFRISPNQDQLAGYTFGRLGVRIYNYSTLQEVTDIPAIIDALRDTSWGRDNQRIAIASGDEIQIWNVKSRQMIADNSQHTGDIATVIGWSPSKQFFAMFSVSQYPIHVDICPSIRIWNATTWQFDTSFHDKSGIFSSVHWGTSNDQLLMARGMDDGCENSPSITVWNKNQGEILNLKNDLGFRNVAWAQNDTSFFASNGLTWYLFDAKMGNILNTVALPQTARHVEWIPKENLLIASVYKSTDAQHVSYTLDFIDAATGDVLLSIPDVQGFGLAHNQTNIAIDYLSGDLEIGSLKRDKNNVIYEPMRTTTSPKVTFWDIQWNQQDTAVELLGLTKTVANEINNQVLQIWDLGTLMPETLFNQPYLLSEAISGFAWHPGGKTFAISRGGGIVEIWSSEN